MIILNLNLDKIPDARTVKGKKGRYIDLCLFVNKDGRDDFGNDGFISISLSKGEREAGDRGEIVGNWKDTDNNRPGDGRGAPSTRAERPPHRREAQPRTREEAGDTGDDLAHEHGDEDIPY